MRSRGGVSGMPMLSATELLNRRWRRSPSTGRRWAADPGGTCGGAEAERCSASWTAPFRALLSNDIGKPGSCFSEQQCEEEDGKRWAEGGETGEAKRVLPESRVSGTAPSRAPRFADLDGNACLASVTRLRSSFSAGFFSIVRGFCETAEKTYVYIGVVEFVVGIHDD